MKKKEIKMFVLVRDKQGNPKFDDYNNIPESIYQALSDSDRAYIDAQREKTR